MGLARPLEHQLVAMLDEETTAREVVSEVVLVVLADAVVGPQLESVDVSILDRHRQWVVTCLHEHPHDTSGACPVIGHEFLLFLPVPAKDWRIVEGAVCANTGAEEDVRDVTVHVGLQDRVDVLWLLYRILAERHVGVVYKPDLLFAHRRRVRCRGRCERDAREGDPVRRLGADVKCIAGLYVDGVSLGGLNCIPIIEDEPHGTHSSPDVLRGQSDLHRTRPPMGLCEETQTQRLPATHIQRDDKLVRRITRLDDAAFVTELPAVPTGREW